MGKADLHIHSGAGDGLPATHEILDYVENETDLDLIAITDHDLIDGSLEARELVAKGGYRFQVLVGMEITTLEGHLLAYDLEEPVRMLQPLTRTIDLVHEQGGFCIVPHPMSWLTLSLQRWSIERILRDPREGIRLEGLEILNPNLAGRVSYERVMALNEQRFHLPELGGSDAHFLSLIGQARTFFPGRTAEDFSQALESRTTRAEGEFLSWEEHRQLAAVAGQQMVKSLVILPSKHIRRALDSFLEGRKG
ncbi:MAG: PHP-associated domain-containing protein [Anaerolineae bacterium]